jgi:hypothetical protein
MQQILQDDELAYRVRTHEGNIFKNIRNNSFYFEEYLLNNILFVLLLFG